METALESINRIIHDVEDNCSGKTAQEYADYIEENYYYRIYFIKRVAQLRSYLFGDTMLIAISDLL